MKVFLLVVWACCATLVCAARQPEIVRQPEIELRELAGTMQVVVRAEGLEKHSLSEWKTPQWQKLLSVVVDQPGTANDEQLPPILGSYQVTPEEILFRPRYAFRPGVAYRVTYDPSVLGSDSQQLAKQTHEFTLQAKSIAPAPVVKAIYPSADRLPENLLKFYVQFSSPMRQQLSTEYVRLLRADGTEVEDPFVNVGQELWDRTGTQLTLLLDPGRVKRGIRPHEEVGPVLIAGKQYVLEIDSRWKNTTGQPLPRTFRKRFTAVPFDRQPPAPAEWQISAPQSGTQDPLVIEFNESMDYALAQRSIEVVSPDGKTIPGDVTLDNLEQRWNFTPTTNWQSGTHTLQIDGRMEDIAAHSVGRPFELDIRADGTTTPALKQVTRMFEVR